MTSGPGIAWGPGSPAWTMPAAVICVRFKGLTTQTASRGNSRASPAKAASLLQSQG
jgi:hypothetical protein